MAQHVIGRGARRSRRPAALGSRRRRGSTATASRSASGSLAISTSAPRARPRRARGRERRVPPGWGRPPSGSRGRDRPARRRSCSGGNPARASTPTTCRARRRASRCTRSDASRAAGTSDSATSCAGRRRRCRSRAGSRNGSSSDASGTVDSGPTASIAAEISTSAGGTICAPVAEVHLVAVVGGRVVAGRDHHPAAQPRWRTANASTGSAAAAAGAARGNPPASTAAVSSANTSDLCRASHPMTTPASAAPGTWSSR